jgi:hypothetical protein
MNVESDVKTETENLIQRMEEFARKAKTAKIMTCPEHDDLEYFSFEQCPACDREQREAKEESDDI